MENYIPHLRRDSADGPFQYAGKTSFTFRNRERSDSLPGKRVISRNKCLLRISNRSLFYDRYAQLWAVKKIKKKE